MFSVTKPRRTLDTQSRVVIFVWCPVCKAESWLSINQHGWCLMGRENDANGSCFFFFFFFFFFFDTSESTIGHNLAIQQPNALRNALNGQLFQIFQKDVLISMGRVLDLV